MKLLLSIIGAVLALWTVIAVALIPERGSEEKVPLVWTTDGNPQREPQVEWFNKLYPDCHLRVDPDNSGVMKVVVQSSAGMGPDIIGHIHPNNIQTYVQAGIVMDITEEAKEMGFGLETLPETVQPLVQLQDPETLEYRQYVYPCNVAHDIIIYNKDIFDKYDVPYLSEDLIWDEYINAARKLTIYDENENVPAIFGSANTPVQVCIWQKGGSLLNEDGTRCLLGEPGAIDGMQFRHDLYYKYGIEPTPTQEAGVTGQGGWGGGSYYSWFGEGKLSMFFGSRWMLIQLRRFFTEQLESKAAWEKEHPGKTYSGPTPPRMGATLVPRFRNGTRYTKFGARCAGINNMSPNRSEALKFLEYLAGEEYSRLINRGADAKPANKKYISLERFTHPDWPGEREIHEMAIKTIPYGRVIRKSFFINHQKLWRILEQTDDQLIANPDLTRDDIARLMKRTAERVDRQIAYNIQRNPVRRKTYERMLDEGAEPIRYELDSIN